MSACGAGLGQRVAGAAVLDEQLAAVLRVGVLLQVAARQRGERGERGQQREQAATVCSAGARKARNPIRPGARPPGRAAVGRPAAFGIRGCADRHASTCDREQMEVREGMSNVVLTLGPGHNLRDGGDEDDRARASARRS